MFAPGYASPNLSNTILPTRKSMQSSILFHAALDPESKYFLLPLQFSLVDDITDV